MNWFTISCIYILPMLEIENIPRFRNCFLNDESHPEYKDKIFVYTRVGWNNRWEWYWEEVLLNHLDFITTYDDEEDSTYWMYVFDIPNKFRDDFDLIIKNEFSKTSEEYKELLYKTYPNLKDKLKTLFNKYPIW